MISRLLAVIFLISSLFLGWWWLVAVLALVYLFYFNGFWWPLAIGLAYDLLYGLPTTWPAVALPMTLWLTAGWIGWILLKRYLFISAY